MDDDLRTAIVEIMEDLRNENNSYEEDAEILEERLNKIGYAFYDERVVVPLKL